MNDVQVHRQKFESFIDFLRENEINYVIMRGYDRLPLFPNTDLDIVIDHLKYSEVLDFLNNSEDFKTDEPSKRFSIDKTECSYDPYFTNHKRCSDIPNGSFRIDLYNHFFYFGKKVVISHEVESDIFKSSVKFKNRYSIPSSSWDALLLMYRAFFDKGGIIPEKYIRRIEFLMPSITNDKEEFERCLNMLKIDNSVLGTAMDTILSAGQVFKFHKENMAFIMWTPKPTESFLSQIEKNNFKILKRQKMQIGGDHKRKYDFLNSIYEIKMNPNDPRIFYSHPFEVIIYEDHNPTYSNIGKPANQFKTPKVLNRKSFEMKNEVRKKYSHLHIHGCDEIHESNKIFEFFKLNQYLNHYAVVPIDLLRAVSYREGQSGAYDLIKIESSPQYAYLNGDKRKYIGYINADPDPLHTVERYEELIERFYPQTVMCDDENMISCQVTDTGYFLITDGLHRASLMKHCGYEHIRVKLKNPRIINYYDQASASSLEPM
jgi:hypothetical protein